MKIELIGHAMDDITSIIAHFSAFFLLDHKSSSHGSSKSLVSFCYILTVDSPLRYPNTNKKK